MSRRVILFALIVVCGAGGAAAAQPLSIYDIQYTADPAGNSAQDGNLVDCLGGVVTHKSNETLPRLYLQDPAHPDGWGAVWVKDWTAALVSSVSVGDWLSLTNVLVEEYRGNTILNYDAANNPGYVIESTGHAVPAPLAVAMAQIAAPTEGPTDFWLVADHDAEPYEGMWLTISDVAVTAMDLGKAEDNYSLHNQAGDVWATDYLNVDAGYLYHPDVSVGQHFDSVTGILEQYTRLRDTSGWDYYQLLTTSSADLVVPDPSTIALLNVGLVVLGLGRAWRRGRRASRR